MKDAIITGICCVGVALIPVAILATIYLMLMPGARHQQAERDCADVGRCLQAGGEPERCRLQYPKCRALEGP